MAIWLPISIIFENVVLIRTIIIEHYRATISKEFVCLANYLLEHVEISITFQCHASLSLKSVVVPKHKFYFILKELFTEITNVPNKLECKK